MFVRGEVFIVAKRVFFWVVLQDCCSQEKSETTEGPRQNLITITFVVTGGMFGTLVHVPGCLRQKYMKY